ncbi:hypothetical protein LX32DRAFT_622936, partial [Colletotrichum zoysiae]
RPLTLTRAKPYKNLPNSTRRRLRLCILLLLLLLHLPFFFCLLLPLPPFLLINLVRIRRGPSGET